MTAVLVTVLFWLTNLDIAVSRLFFDRTTATFDESSFWLFIHNYMNLLPIAIFLVSIIVLCGKLFVEKLCIYRKKALLCILVMVIGPGLIVNGVFKANWGRPRPREIQQFGGTESFVPVLMIGPRKPCNEEKLDLLGEILTVVGIERQRHESFPSGHTALAFYMIVLYLVFYQNKMRRSLLVLGGIYGLIMGMSRIATGHHFLSDVIWSGIIVWGTAFMLDYTLNKEVIDKNIY